AGGRGVPAPSAVAAAQAQGRARPDRLVPGQLHPCREPRGENSMTDYGHELLFGTFVTPTAQPVRHAVEQAVVADRAGLDLVTFQAHPYVARFHDTWTLIAYAAARTERVRLTANVTNLPLRPPAQLARSVATLDRLSGGRIELGLGAGGHWDAIASMG